MPKYRIDWTVEQWKRVTVEADSPGMALQRLWAGDFDEVEPYDGCVQDNVDVTEVDE